MTTKKEEVVRNEILCTTLAKLQSIDAAHTSQMAYIIRRANLSSTVVLAAVSLLLKGKEKLPAYIQSLRKSMAEGEPSSGAEGKLESALSLYNSTYMLFSICLIISSKYLIDRSYINRTWANILMIEKQLLNEYERRLLEVFEYRIELSNASIDELMDKLDAAPTKKEKKEYGFVRRIKKIVACLFYQK
ncbi:uncharacterized protein NEMAJ01_1232 [Nematocida major]|uniref:uncharacterized protein n=1 Tax=Nematocida major TaxID=1912982 RepID=UPI0020076A42|nr:uncharacterized protein NEMAJ01_1232 [Nematocida major]KAH9386336.1 hypothetical protein NEMAJ01_1232 [Nematocida major]